MRDLVRLGGAIARAKLVDRQGGQAVEQLPTVGEDAKGGASLADAKQLLNGEPARLAVVGRLGEIQTILAEEQSATAPRLLTAAPKIRRCQRCVYILSLRRVLQNRLRRLADREGGAAKLSVDVGAPVGCHGDPQTRKAVETIVNRAVFAPMLWDLEGVDLVLSCRELREILPVKDVPIAVQKRVALPLWQSEQTLLIGGIRRHQKTVVVHDRGQKDAAHAVLSRKFPKGRGGIDEARLDPSVSHAPGVGGGLDLLGVGVGSSDTGDEVEILPLGEVGKLVEAHHVVLRTLILVHVALGGAVAEINAGAVFEFSHVRGEIEREERSWVQRERRTDERLVELREGTSENQLLGCGIGEREEEGVHDLTVGLAASRRTAE